MPGHGLGDELADPLLDVVPSVAAGVVGVLALQLLRSRSRSRTRPAADEAGAAPAAPTDAAAGRSRRGFLAALGGTAAVAALAGGGGFVVSAVRDAGSAARRALGLPAPASPANPAP